MPREGRKDLVAVAIAAAMTAGAGAAGATPTEACVAASERAQELRNAGKLSAAREALVTCSEADCPKIVQTDCTRWMGEILAALPSVVPAAKDSAGRDLVEARFSIDGRIAAE